jgi:hypothetical protein
MFHISILLNRSTIADIPRLQSYRQLLKLANNRSSFRLLQTTEVQSFENKKLHSASSAPLFLLKKQATLTRGLARYTY